MYTVQLAIKMIYPGCVTCMYSRKLSGHTLTFNMLQFVVWIENVQIFLNFMSIIIDKKYAM